jgi:D-lactate dehydrogenase
MLVNKKFLSDIEKILSKQQIIADITRRRAFGTDASFYQLVPELVLQIEDEQQMQQVIETANLHSVPVTFRAAGTSLSGQAITDSVLIMLTNAWAGHEILNQGHLIRL